jgi:hypothetical protein
VKWKIRDEWFYGIGLSDKAVFDTNNLEIRPGNVENGLPVFIVKNRHSQFNEFEVIERLKYTLDYIDSKKDSAEFSREKWNGEYNNNWWNDEHLSRFISNNEVVSYKAKTPSKEDKKNKKKNKKKLILFWTKTIQIILASKLQILTRTGENFQEIGEFGYFLLLQLALLGQ